MIPYKLWPTFLLVCGAFGFAILRADPLSPVPDQKPAHYPEWWFKRDVIRRVDPLNMDPDYAVAGTYKQAGDFAAANLGQLKYIAAKAAAEMDASLPGPGAGSEIDALIEVWTAAPALGATRDDYAALNQGQLKNVAKLFYDRLAIVGYTGQPLLPLQRYPWTATTDDDKAYSLVNLGQLKQTFSFFASGYFLDAYMADADLDGIPTGWELEHNLDPENPADAAQLNGGLTNLQIYQQSLATGGDPKTANPVGLSVYTP